MLKTCRCGDSGVARSGLIRGVRGVLLVVGIGLLGPGRLAVAPAIAQDRASPSDPRGESGRGRSQDRRH